MLDGVFHKLRSDNRMPIKSVDELAMLITSHCIGFVDNCRELGRDHLRYLDIFGKSIDIVVSIFFHQPASTKLWPDGKGNAFSQQFQKNI